MAVVDKLKELSKVTLPAREVKTTTAPPVTTPITTAAGDVLTAEQFMSLLEQAKRVS